MTTREWESMSLRERARDMWEFPGSVMKLCEIAATLDIPPGTVRAWKYRDGWSGAERRRAEPLKRGRRRGGQPGNRNAAGHGAKPWNVNAVVHGFYSRHPSSIIKKYTGDGFIIKRAFDSNMPAMSIPDLSPAFIQHELNNYKERIRRGRSGKGGIV